MGDCPRTNMSIRTKKKSITDQKRCQPRPEKKPREARKDAWETKKSKCAFASGAG